MDNNNIHISLHALLKNNPSENHLVSGCEIQNISVAFTNDDTPPF